MQYDQRYVPALVSQMELELTDIVTNGNQAVFKGLLDNALGGLLYLSVAVGKPVDCSCPLASDFCLAFDAVLSLWKEGVKGSESLALAVLPSDKALSNLSGDWGRVWSPREKSTDRRTAEYTIRFCRGEKAISNPEMVISILANYAFKHAKLASRIDWLADDVLGGWSTPTFPRPLKASSIEEAIPLAMDNFSFKPLGYVQGYGELFTNLAWSSSDTFTVHVGEPIRGDAGIEYSVSLDYPKYSGLNPDGLFRLNPWLGIYREYCLRAGIKFEASAEGNKVTMTFRRDQAVYNPGIAIAFMCRYAADSAHNLTQTIEKIKAVSSTHPPGVFNV